MSNFDGLRTFAEEKGATSYPSSRNAPRSDFRAQFLWDYIAHTANGLLIVAESEFDQHAQGLRHDFEKLLYVRSPIKVMLTRVRSEDEAAEQAASLRIYMDDCCTEYSPGEVFILYAVWWAEPDGGKNRDIAYVLQVPGTPAHCGIGDASFVVEKRTRP